MDMETKAQKEKQWAATSSVVTAFGLNGIKLTVGIMTGSLGILAEAAHSGLDIIAAGITAFAVKKIGQTSRLQAYLRSREGRESPSGSR